MTIVCPAALRPGWFTLVSGEKVNGIGLAPLVQRD